MRQLGQIGPIVYLCIKFDVSHLSRSSDISGPKKILMGCVILTTPILRVICNPYADHSSFSRSRYIVGAHQNLNGLRDLTTPLSGMVWHPRASTCYGQPIYQI